MRSHADELARLRDAVVEAAKAETAAESLPARGHGVHTSPIDIAMAERAVAVTALLAAEAATCPECGGHARVQAGPQRHDGTFGYDACPSCSGTGRKPDARQPATFHDDGATTPEDQVGPPIDWEGEETR